jgi:hypothetical protein
MALLSPSRVGGESMRVFGFGPRKDDSDQVCCEVSVTVTF